MVLFRHALILALGLTLGSELLIGPAAASAGSVLTREDPSVSLSGGRLRRSVRSIGRCTATRCRATVFEVAEDAPSGLLEVRVRWRSRRHNLDLYLYRDGQLQASSRRRRSRSERIVLDSPMAGSYRAVVVPRRVRKRGTRFRGSVKLVAPILDANGIVADCTRDASTAIKALIRSVPDGGSVSFDPAGCYRIDGSVRIVDRWGLTLDGNGATFRAMTSGDQDRRHFWFIGGGDLTIRNMTVRGANPHAGLARAAYQAGRAFQHGFAFHGVRGGLLEKVKVHDVYGDFVYFGHDVRTKPFVPAQNITVQDSHFERNGRQGIGIGFAEDITIQRNHLGEVRRAIFDLEPNTEYARIRRIAILNNTTGRSKLLWLASAGRGYNVSDIRVVGNTMLNRASGAILRLLTPEGGTRGPFLIEQNSFRVGGSPWAALHFRRARDVLIRSNTISMMPDRNMTSVGSHGSHQLNVIDNTISGAKSVLFCSPDSTDCSESGNG